MPVYLEPMSYWHLEQVISKLRRTIWKFWLKNQRQTGIIKETQYTLQKRASVLTLSALASHSLLLRFYSLAGIKPLTEAYIFQPISSLTTKGGKTKSNRPIGYSSYREMIKKALAAAGEIPEMFGTYSLRSGEATAIAERMSDTPDWDRLLRLQGRWKTDTSRDAYIKDSLTNRLSVTKILQL